MKRALARLVGPQEAELLTYAPARQGARSALPANNGGRPTRQTERLRAVQERAPRAIRDLYTAGILPLASAARFGPATPTAAQVEGIRQAEASAAELVRKLGESPSDAERAVLRKEAQALLPERPSPSGAASRLMERCRALSVPEREVFIGLFEGWLRDLEGGGRHLGR